MRWPAWVDTVLEKCVPLAVLSTLLMYTYVELWYAPYVGFNFSTSGGEITHLFTKNPLDIDLQEGDRLRQVEGVTWDGSRRDARQPLIPRVSAGQHLTIHVVRDGVSLELIWGVQSPSLQEILDRVINLWWLGYAFWFFGTLTALLLRPKDSQWRLLVVFYFLTAIWLVAGNTSRWRFWESAVVMRTTIWLSMPVYLHLHWIYPQPLKRLPALVWPSLYSAGLLLAVIQWFQWLPTTAYLYGFMLAILGSLGLLVFRLITQPSQRISIRLIPLATALAFIPLLGISVATAFQALPWYGAIGLPGLLPIPGAYFYAVYRHQLGDLELRTNRLIALYLFLLLMGTIALVVVAIAMTRFPASTILISVMVALGSVIGTVWGFPRFQQLVERYLLGILPAPRQLLETYAARIATRLNLSELTHLLQQEILPGLLVRQSALLRLHDDGRVDIVFAQGVEVHQLPGRGETLNPLMHRAGRRLVRLGDSEINPLAWPRLILPLRLDDQPMGVWLLGKRDPDDTYGLSEISTFEALADQIAIALSNIDQAELLRSIYQANVDRHETERTHLALILHDEVLHLLAALSMVIDTSEASAQFEQAYQAVTDRIRQLITGLRPAMLTYGLGAALEELADDLSNRAGGVVAVECKVDDSQARFTPHVEQYLFRIVQQACENALRHAQAQTIRITGTITSAQVMIVVADDGVGFAAGHSLDLTSLLANKHFGLVGMHERAEIIGADLQVESEPGKGTRVSVRWRPKAQG